MANTLLNQAGILRKIDWRNGTLSGGFIVLIALALWMVAAQAIDTPATQQANAARLAFEEKTGVRIVRVVLAAAGGVVDLHYQVLDPDKALAMHDKDSPPVILNQGSGVVIDKPFHSHVSTDRSRVGGAYRLQLLNTAGAVKLGDKLTLVVGDARLEHIVVER